METILIVEDDQPTQKALKRLFESEGYDVEIRGDGKSALEAFRTAAPTAIILDLRLPVVAGKDVCREIRQQSSTLPIIVFSASTDESDRKAILCAGIGGRGCWNGAFLAHAHPLGVDELRHIVASPLAGCSLRRQRTIFYAWQQSTCCSSTIRKDEILRYLTAQAFSTAASH
jgi:CheY-like chemotaxis protein